MINLAITFMVLIDLYILYLIIDELSPRHRGKRPQEVPQDETITPLTTMLETLKQIAKDADEVIPAKSCYRTWAIDLRFERLKAIHYSKLRNRLLEYVKKNGYENRFNLN